MKTINYGIVGTGYFGAELGRILKTLDGAAVVAVYDPENGKTIAEEFGCKCEDSLEALVSEPDIDAVIVATPNYLHKEPVIKAAEHKKHVFCEKPIALSYQDCDEMVKAAEKNGVIFMAGHIMNFFHGVRLAKKFIQEGKIGKLLYAHSARNGWEEQQPEISWKKIRAKSGGHLYHHIHELDCIQFIMGPATEATMIGGNVAHKGEHFGDEDDLLLLSLRLLARFQNYASGKHIRIAKALGHHKFMDKPPCCKPDSKGDECIEKFHTYPFLYVDREIVPNCMLTRLATFSKGIKKARTARPRECWAVRDETV